MSENEQHWVFSGFLSFLDSFHFTRLSKSISLWWLLTLPNVFIASYLISLSWSSLSPLVFSLFTMAEVELRENLPESRSKKKALLKILDVRRDSTRLFLEDLPELQNLKTAISSSFELSDSEDSPQVTRVTRQSLGTIYWGKNFKDDVRVEVSKSKLFFFLIAKWLAGGVLLNSHAKEFKTEFDCSFTPAPGGNQEAHVQGTSCLTGTENSRWIFLGAEQGSQRPVLVKYRLTALRMTFSWTNVYPCPKPGHFWS